MLALVDTVSGLIHPPMVVEEEESASAWGVLFRRAREAGLDLDRLGGVTSDGAQGLLAYLGQALSWVRHQRCVWHFLPILPPNNDSREQIWQEVAEPGGGAECSTFRVGPGQRQGGPRTGRRASPAGTPASAARADRAAACHYRRPKL